MDKQMILRMVQAELEGELRRHLAAQQTAADGATHAEARAETKWDTCGLEQSYLARGHAKQFETLAKQVEELRSFIPPVFKGKPIDTGALAEVESDGESLLFFLLHCGGGVVVRADDREITVITAASPVGTALIGKMEGDTYSFRAGQQGVIRYVE